MATVLQNLQTALANVAANLAAITANPQPDYSIGGKSYSWAAYFNTLVSQQESLNRAIAVAGGPVEAATQGVS